MIRLATVLILISSFITPTLWAQIRGEQPSTFNLDQRTYVKQNGVWYADFAGQRDEIRPGKLVLKKIHRAASEDLASFGVTVTGKLAAGYFCASVNSNQDPFAVATALEADGYYVEFVAKARFSAEPNDFYYSQNGSFDGQWNMHLIDMARAWDITRGDASIVVAVSDNGVEDTHEDLNKNIWSNPLEIPGNGVDDDHNGYIDDTLGWDFRDMDNDPNPAGPAIVFPDPHGTNVAGLIVGDSNNTIGMAGIAGGWNSTRGASLMNLRGSQDTDVLLATVLYAAQNGAHVVNMSWGTYVDYTYMEEVINFISNNYHMVMVCAAGNNDVEQVEFPAAYEATIAVGSSTPNDERGYTAYGADLDLVAPSYVLTTDIMGERGTPVQNLEADWQAVNGVYSEDYNPLFGGTSSSAPQVAGAVALMLSHNPGVSPELIKQNLRSAVRKVGPYNYNWNPAMPGHSKEMGYGRLDVRDAILAAQFMPSIQVTSPAPGEIVSVGTTFQINWNISTTTNVKLELYDEDGLAGTIASSVSGSTYSWNVSQQLETGHQYRIKVSSTTNAQIYQYSQRAFTIDAVDIINIPDGYFLDALIAEGVDTSGDGQIDENEAAAVVSLDVSRSNISDLTGFEAFTSLQHFNCSQNYISDLAPIIANTSFMDPNNCSKSLDISYNQLGTGSTNGWCDLICNCWSSYDDSNQPTAFSCVWCPPAK